MEVKFYTIGEWTIKHDTKMRHNSWQVYRDGKWHSWFDTFKQARTYCVLQCGL